MPIDPITGGIIASAANSGLNWLSNQFTGNQQNNYNENQAAQQQAWNKQNQQQQQNWNQQQWQMQNQYNSPQEQMARFKAAGLNPHLIYGKGSSGPASTITSPDVKPYTRSEAANTARGFNAFGDYNQFKQIQAQTDNVRQQTQIGKQEETLKAQLAANAAITGARGSFELGKARELKQYQMDAAKVGLQKLQSEADMTETNANFALKSAPSKIQKLKRETENAKLSGNLTKLKILESAWERELNKLNMTKSDPLWARGITRFIKEIYETPYSSKGFGKAIGIKKIK